MCFTCARVFFNMLTALAFCNLNPSLSNRSIFSVVGWDKQNLGASFIALRVMFSCFINALHSATGVFTPWLRGNAPAALRA